MSSGNKYIKGNSRCFYVIVTLSHILRKVIKAYRAEGSKNKAENALKFSRWVRIFWFYPSIGDAIDNFLNILDCQKKFGF